MRRIWKIKEKADAKEHLLAKALSISPILAQILINRNIKTPEKAKLFLNPKLLDLHDPFYMKGMGPAYARIKKAIAQKEKILVYGDYDVDGITAVALMTLVLKHLGVEADSYIPNRLEEGYGLNKNAIAGIHKKGTRLLITVDCGVTAFKEIEELNRLGIDTIITDHHTPPHKLPDALCILNPLQKDCTYPDKHLSGVGVAFKLASALLGRDSDTLYELLDLVCLGTVADVVPLVGENRILVKIGLEQLTNTKRAGLKALIEESYLSGKDMTSYYVGYILGPRINATGRLGSPETSLKLLLTDNAKEAKDLAKVLCQENKNRQKMEELVLREATKRVEREIDFTKHNVIVLEDENWHQGVIGIVASRLVDKFYRPAVMISLKGATGKGSGRSIKNFHLFDAFSECSELLKTYGGHSYAAGLTLEKDKLAEFKKRINDIAKEKILAQDLLPVIEIDMEMPLSFLDDKLLSDIEKLTPFGLGNPRPVFSSYQVNFRTSPQVFGRDSIRAWITDGKVTAEATGFNIADFIPSDPLNQAVDIAYTCNLDTYKGITSIKLQLKDLRLSCSVAGV